MTTITARVREHWRSDAARQLVRFLIGGALTTFLYALAYAALAGFKITSEQVANFVGYLVAMLSGYVIHSKWSFQGHGAAAQRTSWRFVVVSLLSYAMNTFWVWLLTAKTMLAGAWWWPLLPVAFCTPLINFWLNRTWVFSLRGNEAG